MGWRVRHHRPEDSGKAEDFYSRHGSRVYEKNAMRHIQEKILLRGLQLVPIPEGAGVLDAGCGTGFGMQLLSRLGYSVSGFDASEEMISRARAKGFNVVVGDMRRIPFPDSAFEAIVSISALQWVPLKERLKAAREFRRVLADGGVAVVQFYPASEREALATGRLFRRAGFKATLHTDNSDNPRKRKIFLLLHKP